MGITHQISGPTRVNEVTHQYFTVFTWTKAAFYAVALVYVIVVCFILVLEPFLALPCDAANYPKLDFGNPLYDQNPCRRVRTWPLLWMTKEECDFGRRLLASVVLGGIIGWERRSADRPAGIRTMSLVSLGSCLFTINSAFAFLSGPMGWDASRISAAIPSGVGFLGAGLIFKQTEKDDSGVTNNVVHGLTTAASIWISAAVGIACGGNLYFPATFGTAIILLTLRFGPRTNLQEGEDDDEEDQDGFDQNIMSSPPRDYKSTVSASDDKTSDESQNLIHRKHSLRSARSQKKLPQLV